MILSHSQTTQTCSPNGSQRKFIILVRWKFDRKNLLQISLHNSYQCVFASFLDLDFFMFKLGTKQPQHISKQRENRSFLIFLSKLELFVCSHAILSPLVSGWCSFPNREPPCRSGQGPRGASGGRRPVLRPLRLRPDSRRWGPERPPVGGGGPETQVNCWGSQGEFRVAVIIPGILTCWLWGVLKMMENSINPRNQ